MRITPNSAKSEQPLPQGKFPQFVGEDRSWDCVVTAGEMLTTSRHGPHTTGERVWKETVVMEGGGTVNSPLHATESLSGEDSLCHSQWTITSSFLTVSLQDRSRTLPHCEHKLQLSHSSP